MLNDEQLLLVPEAQTKRNGLGVCIADCERQWNALYLVEQLRERLAD